ncbi:MAG: MFS transporter, partial [Bdellovibrionota bacterium]
MKKSEASLLFIFITVTLEMIGIGLIIPSLPGIMRRFVSEPAQVSAYYGYFVSLYACMQFLASPFLGALSDRFGRRPVLLVSLCCAGLDYLLMAFA